MFIILTIQDWDRGKFSQSIIQWRKCFFFCECWAVCGIVIDPIIRRVRGPMGLPGSTSIVTRLLPRCLKYAPHAPRQPSKEYLWPSSPAPQRKPQNVQYSFLSLQIKIIMKENPGNRYLLTGKPLKLSSIWWFLFLTHFYFSFLLFKFSWSLPNLSLKSPLPDSLIIHFP